MIKKTALGAVVVMCLAMAVGTGWGLPTTLSNPGFESGMTGWNVSYTQDGSNGGYTSTYTTMSAIHYNGSKAFLGGAAITGDWSEWSYDDWCRTYLWSEQLDLRNAASIDMYMSLFQNNGGGFGWGWGQEVFLLLSDGTNTVSCLMVQQHQQPYGLSLVDQGLYTNSLGNDGQNWYKFHVLPNATYFGSGISGLNLAQCKIGFEWEAISWNSSPLVLLSMAAVDDITVNQTQLVPEPVTMSLFVGSVMAGLGTYIRRRK